MSAFDSDYTRMKRRDIEREQVMLDGKSCTQAFEYLQEQITSLRTDRDNLFKEINKLYGINRALEQEQSAAKDREKRRDDELDNLQRRVAVAHKGGCELERRMASLDRQGHELLKRVRLMETRQAKLHNKLCEVWPGDALRERIRKLEGVGVESPQREIQYLHERLDNHAKRISDLEVKTVRVENRVAKIEGVGVEKVTPGAQHRLNEIAEQRLTDLSKRLQRLEEQLAGYKVPTPARPPTFPKVAVDPAAPGSDTTVTPTYTRPTDAEVYAAYEYQRKLFTPQAAVTKAAERLGVKRMFVAVGIKRHLGI